MDIQRKIWDYCKAKGMTDAGAAAVLGNIEAESVFVPNNVENRCPITDDEYTGITDSGTYAADKFIHDRYGYGLCQWTLPSRKSMLLTMAQNRGCSIADVDMQLDLMWRELSESYGNVLSTLKTSNSVRECTEAFMRKYENPADQSERAIANRTGMSMKWYDRFAHTADKPVEVVYKYVTVQLRELCEGLQGDDVYTMQRLLFHQGENLETDGIFGTETKITLMHWQKENGLTADGICGKNTWSKLLGAKTN